jgi:N-acetylglucosaminyl-diphospho-decaprenol L-rhamnosyltransferase
MGLIGNGKLKVKSLARQGGVEALIDPPQPAQTELGVAGRRPPATALGIVVLTLGTATESGSLVRSLVEEGCPPSSVVIVHNPGEVGQPAIESPYPAVGVLRPDANIGYAAGMNLGMRHLRRQGARTILLLTHDVRFRPGALAALLDGLRRNPAFGVMGPALWIRGEDRPFSYGGITTDTGENIHLMTPSPQVHGVATTDWIDGCAMAIRGEVVDAVGGLDERFFAYCEESEFCLRATRAGWKIGVVLEAVAEQAPGRSKRPGAHAYLLCRNGLEYARLARGARGVVAGLGRAMYQVAADARRILRVKAGRRPPATAAESSPRLVGTIRGVVDFLRRRWGPPPPSLPGMGDCRNLPPRPRQRGSTARRAQATTR